MSTLGPKRQYRILPEASSSIIGSHRSDRQGTLYTIDVNLNIAEPANRRAKWLFDKSIAIAVILFLPLFFWAVKQAGQLWRNAFTVLIGSKHWVGYAPAANAEQLPPLKEGVLHPAAGRPAMDAATRGYLNFLYARDYGIGEDWRIFWRGIW
ncbi:MAG: hypothetical protein AAGA31_13495 [Bacteroidota bacterium]